MDVSFQTTKLKKLCTDNQHAERKLGPKKAKKLRLRLDDLQAASCLNDLRYAPGRLHELTGNRTGQFALDLEHPYRLIFVPQHKPPPQTSSGGLDWTQITAVEIIEIIDYH